MTPQDTLQILGWVARAIGALYVFAGVVTLRAWRLNQALDRAIAQIELKPTDGMERIKGWTVLAVGGLTLMSGGLLMLLNPFAPHAFLACAALQGAYFAWARKAIPPTDDAGRRGRKASTNAFLLFVGATVFVLGCRIAGLFH